jgi:hypothetical protein
MPCKQNDGFSDGAIKLRLFRDMLPGTPPPIVSHVEIDGAFQHCPQKYSSSGAAAQYAHILSPALLISQPS